MKPKNKFTCPKCGAVSETIVEKRTESYPVKGDPISILANVRVCLACGQDVYDRDLDSQNLQLAYDEFRQKHHVISPAEICSMRQNYGLSQRGLGTLLGWGEVTIHRYENGSLPDDAHNQVLYFIQDPFNMERIVEVSGHRLKQATLRKLQDQLGRLLRENATTKLAEVLSQRVAHKVPGYYEINCLEESLTAAKENKHEALAAAA